MKTILVIEPNKLFAQNIYDLLEDKGFSIDLVASAQDAITAADGRTPDLAVLELQLVGHNGIEFLYEFRSYHDWEKIPVIIYSQVPKERFAQTTKALKQLGVRRYLDKSKTGINELVSVVEDELEE